MKLVVATAHAGATCLAEAANSWHVQENLPLVAIFDGTKGMLNAYQNAFTALSETEIIAFFHDDLILHDKSWVDRVLAEFEDPKVGLVGFGGATRHGEAGLYRDPYEYKQLARGNFLSNMTDAENHGRRFTGSCDVAVLDGFSLIVRREILEQVGGWPLNTPIGYLCYDYWLSCITRRLGYRIRVVCVPCTHLGGRTFVAMGIGEREDHWPKFLAAHEYIYNEFRDVLPARVTQ